MDDLEKYILKDDKENGVIIFGDKDMVQKFNECENVFIDGTFGTVLQGFDQLYLIHGIINNKNIPFFYCLLRSKKNVVYERMFKLIDELTDGGISNHSFVLMGDFEIMKFSFLNDNNNIKKKCCQFHLFQSISRKARELKCSKELVEDIMTLSIAPSTRVISLFHDIIVKYICNENEYLDGDTEMIIYFYKNYIKGNVAKIENWNVSDQIHRTNNICESFNNELKNFFRKIGLGNPDKVKKPKNFYTGILSFLEYKKRSLTWERNKRINKYSTCKTVLIQQINEKHAEFNNESLLVLLKIIRRISFNYMKEKEKCNPFGPLSDSIDFNTITTNFINFHNTMKELRINDTRLLKELKEIEEMKADIEKIIDEENGKVENRMDIIQELYTEESVKLNDYNDENEEIIEVENETISDDENAIISEIEKAIKTIENETIEVSSDTQSEKEKNTTIVTVEECNENKQKEIINIEEESEEHVNTNEQLFGPQPIEQRMRPREQRRRRRKTTKKRTRKMTTEEIYSARENMLAGLLEMNNLNDLEPQPLTLPNILNEPNI